MTSRPSIRGNGNDLLSLGPCDWCYPQNGNLCSRARQSERNRTADAAIAAGDNGNLAVKVKGLEICHSALPSVV